MITTAAVPHCSIDDQHIETSPAYRNIVLFMGEKAAKETIEWVYVELKPDD